MPARIIKPNSNWHRLVHLLDRNRGTMYLAQLYKPKRGQAKHPEVVTDGMPLMTEFGLLSGPAMRYEAQAERMGFVRIQRQNNRTWITLLPKGRDVLKAFAEGKKWNTQEDRPVFEIHKTVKL